MKLFHHENMKSGTRRAGAPAAPALARRVRRVRTKFILPDFCVFACPVKPFFSV
jgi:hypothetical protein